MSFTYCQRIWGFTTRPRYAAFQRAFVFWCTVKIQIVIPIQVACWSNATAVQLKTRIATCEILSTTRQMLNQLLICLSKSHISVYNYIDLSIYNITRFALLFNTLFLTTWSPVKILPRWPGKDICDCYLNKANFRLRIRDEMNGCLTTMPVVFQL